MEKSSTWIKHLVRILLLISLFHVALKFLFIWIPQWNNIEDNETNTHFALSSVIILLLLFLIGAILNDFIFGIYTSFKWIEGFNITLIATCLFVFGFLLCYAGEIGFAIFNPFETCKQLGLNKNFKPKVDEHNNSTVITDEDNDIEKKESCDNAIAFTTGLLLIDLIIMSVFIPLHSFVLAHSWRFSALYRKRPETDPDSSTNSDIYS